MFAQPTRLHVRRPSPNTVGYTVSNASPVTTVSQRTLTYVLAGLRICLSISSLVTLLAKTQLFTLVGLEQYYTSWLSRFTTLAQAFLLSVPWHVLAPACFGILYVCCQRPYTEESLLVLQSLGIQTSTSSSTYLSSATTRFIPTSEIQDIFIHEAFIGFEVRYYLAIVVKNETELTVVFPKLLPRLAILEEVWRGARSCIFASLQPGPGKMSSSSSRPQANKAS